MLNLSLRILSRYIFLSICFLWCIPQVYGENSFVVSPEITQQSGKISGIVEDDMGAIAGATIMVKGTSNGTASDLDGNFTLEGLKNGDILVVSYVGYKTQEIGYTGQSSITVTLQDDALGLDEIVVVGYGVQKKVNLTGAVTAISTKDLDTRVNTNLLSSVQGQVPGVTIISRPGTDPSINFRGRGNLKTSSPLYIIDGAIADATLFGALDPNSIESISFLKDAASSAIYGSRAAYGVVLVKTKEGSVGDVRVNYNGYVGTKKAMYTPKILGSEWYARLTNEAALNDNPNAELPFSDSEIRMFADGSNPDMYPNSDWYNLVFNDHAMTTKHSLNLSGGDKVRFFTSLGYLYDEEFTPDRDNTRYNFSTNLSSDIKPWLTFRGNINYIQDKKKNEKADVSYVDLLTTSSTFVAKQSNGEWGSYDGGKPAAAVNLTRNPLRKLEEGGWWNRKTQNTLLNLAFDVKPVKGLVLTGEMIYKSYDYKNKKYTASMGKIKDFVTGLELNGSEMAESKMEYEWYEHDRLIYNGLANYNWSNTEHSFGVLAGTSYEHYRYQKQKSSRKGFPTNNMTDMNGGSSSPNDSEAEGGSEENKMMSYFGRVNYSFKDRYLLEANVRVDGSSRFHEDHRWATFPSFSAGWRINEEDFMQDLNWLNNLKVRASWGMLGNINNVGDYDYFSSYKQGGNYNFENTIVSGIIESKPANATLGWEKVTITDIGLDISVLNGLISFTGDYYNKKTNDILLGYNVPLETGINKDNKPSQNIGSLSNKGVEIGLTHYKRFGDFSYSIGGNISYNKNKVEDLADSGPMIVDEVFIQEVGYAIGTFYGFKTNGLLTQADIDNGDYITDGLVPNAGDIKYVDKDGDGKLTSADRDYIGCDVPDFTYGINLNLQYKGFELGVFGQGVDGTKVRFWQEQAWAFADYANPREYHLKRWTTENPDPGAAYTRIYSRTSAHSTFNQKFSDFWLFDADYFRIKTINLGYAIPKKVVRPIGVEALTVYVTAENPFTIRADKRMEDFDPESATGRGTNTRSVSSFVFGVNLTF